MIRQKILAGLVISVVLSIVGCTTPNPDVLTVTNQNMSLIELTKIIRDVLPVGVRNLSPNSREYTSQVFIIKNGQYSDAKDARIRYWARILVLNDARPYDLELEVRKEVRDDRDGRIKYVDVGADMGLATILLKQLKDRLAKRRDDLNLIDDFRVF